MKLVWAEDKHIPDLVRISKEAFDSDVTVGAAAAGGPSEYDSVDWHMEMMREGRLLTAIENEVIVGGAIIFKDKDDCAKIYIGRIFVDPGFFRKGFGVRIMEQLEAMNPTVTVWNLETPIWNQRTNRFYKKLGYTEIHRDHEAVFYQKIIS